METFADFPFACINIYNDNDEDDYTNEENECGYIFFEKCL